MEQMAFSFLENQASPPACDPLDLLAPETEPEWLEDALEIWDAQDNLLLYLDNLKSDLRSVENIPGRFKHAWEWTMERSLRDPIKVVRERLKQLTTQT